MNRSCSYTTHADCADRKSLTNSARTPIAAQWHREVISRGLQRGTAVLRELLLLACTSFVTTPIAAEAIRRRYRWRTHGVICRGGRVHVFTPEVVTSTRRVTRGMIDWHTPSAAAPRVETRARTSRCLEGQTQRSGEHCVIGPLHSCGSASITSFGATS